MDEVVSILGEKSLLSKLRIVVIDCAYNTLSDPFTQKMFGKFLNLKLDGFVSEYGHGILPLGSYDFIGTIVMICEKRGSRDDDLEPITCFKSSTFERAQYFKLPFEVNALFHSDAEKIHAEYVRDAVQKAKSASKVLGYNSSWTMDSKWGRGSPLRKFMLNLSLSALVNYYTDYKIDEVLSSAILKFKIDAVQTFLGFEYIQYQGQALPEIETWFVKNEKSLLMHLRGFAPAAKDLALQHRNLWENRITLGYDDLGMFDRKAA